MIRQIIIYQTQDGTRFDTMAAAEEYERLYYRCVEVMQKLGEHATERKAIKHDRNRVDLCFKKFLEICAIQIPAERHIFIGVRDGNVHRSHAEKVLSDFHYKYPCLWDSYFRFDCIGPSGVEYEQPFFAYNEDKYDGDVVLQQQFRY